MTPAISRRRTKTWDDSQPDLFIALPSDIPARDQQDLMERPLFHIPSHYVVEWSALIGNLLR